MTWLFSSFLLSVVEYVEDYYSSYREREDRDTDNDSEDSNDENNWRNDYPDEDEIQDDDTSSVGEADMRRAMTDFDIGKNILMFLTLISQRHKYKSVFYNNESNPFTNRRFFWVCKK